MEVFLGNMVASFTGSISRKHGYSIKCRNGRFYGVRNPTNVPPDGHWNFIADCAQLAQTQLFISDVSVHAGELQTALYEAHHFVASEHVRHNYADNTKRTYNARDISNLKTLFGL